MLINKSLQEILHLQTKRPRNYPQTHGFPATSIKRQLTILKQDLHTALPKETYHHIAVSKGYGYLPTILYAAIKPFNSPKLAHIGITFLFDIRGRGFLFGVLDSITYPNPTLRKLKSNFNTQFVIDGGRHTNQYSRGIIQMKEISSKEILEFDFLKEYDQFYSFLIEHKSNLEGQI